jgi:SAM-dependent methyltransferase
MLETSKTIMRRLSDSRFLSRYFVGEGIDIGAGNDPLASYAQLFPLCRGVRSWDIKDGDAQYMHGVDNSSYDFVHSSHCLEHMISPEQALWSWWNILRPNGHLIILVPDEDLYEQGQWPSRFNPDHKHTFTIYKKKSWSPVSVNVISLIETLQRCETIKIELLDASYRRSNQLVDQTTTPIGECAIEIILRKR